MEEINVQAIDAQETLGKEIVAQNETEQPKGKKEKYRKKISVFSIVCFVALSLYSLVLVAMCFWGVLTSMKQGTMAFRKNILGFPEVDSFSDIFNNYKLAFKHFKVEAVVDGRPWQYGFGDMFYNSLIYSLGCTFFATVTPMCVAYCVAKFKFKFNKVIMGAVLVAMVIPMIGQLPSEVAIAKAIGFYDTMVGAWLMKANFLGMYFLIFYSTFKLIPNSYAESVYLDGGNQYTVFFRIILPLSKTTISVVAVLLFIAFWNDYQTPMLFIPNRPTAALGLYHFQWNNSVDALTGVDFGSVPMKLTAAIILFVPVLIFFLIFKNKMMGNLTMGGLKE